MFGTDYSFKEFIDNQAEKMITSAKERKEKMDLYESLPPGHPERIALEIELEIGKKPDHLGDDGGSPEVPQVVSIGGESEQYAQPGFDYWGFIKERQAQKKAYDEKMAQENLMLQQPGLAYGQQFFNKGGLANLFRVKNQ